MKFFRLAAAYRFTLLAVHHKVSCFSTKKKPNRTPSSHTCRNDIFLKENTLRIFKIFKSVFFLKRTNKEFRNRSSKFEKINGPLSTSLYLRGKLHSQPQFRQQYSLIKPPMRSANPAVSLLLKKTLISSLQLKS